MNITNILKNKVFFYLSSRYLTYGLQFVTSLIIAAKLGPYYFGIWGFLLLLLQYFQQCHFGIYNSFSVLYVQHRDNPNQCKTYVLNALLLETYLAILVIIILCVYLINGGELFKKYDADKYFIWVCVIAILQYFQSLIVNIFRVKNLLNYVTVCQSIIVILNFICIFFFEGELLINILLAGYIIGNLLALVLAWTSGVLNIKGADVSRVYQGEIIKKGFLLFLYNTSFYFIIISIRTIISSNYTVEEFGQFTFSFSLAHAVLLLLEAIVFVVFPKVIGKLSSNNDEDVSRAIAQYRTIYTTSAHGLIYSAIIFFPVLISFFPKYNGALNSMYMIALTVLINTCGCGYSDLLIARNKERILSIVSIVALVLNCIIALFLVKILAVDFSYVILASMISYMVLCYMVVSIGQKILNDGGVKKVMAILFPLRLYIPFVIAFVLSFLQVKYLMFLPLIVFIVLNPKECKTIVSMVKTIIVKPSVVDL